MTEKLNLTESEEKKALRKQRKAEAKLSEESKHQQEKGDGYLHIEEPLMVAHRLLKPLINNKCKNIKVFIIAFEIYIAMSMSCLVFKYSLSKLEKPLLALKCLQHAHKIDSNHPILSYLVIKMKNMGINETTLLRMHLIL